MKREFHAQFPLALKDSVSQGFALAWLVRQSLHLPARWPEIAQIEDDWARLEILSQAIVTGRKEEARMGTRKMGGGLRYWGKRHAETFFGRQLGYMRALRLTPPHLPDLATLPPGSWAVQLTFTLRKPYISKDDTDFYILDNPVKKEHVFKVPYVAPSQWKGALRAAMVRELVTALGEGEVDEAKFVEKRLQMYRLFGNEKDGTAEFLNRALARFRLGPPPQEDGEEATRQWRERLEREIKVVAEKFETLLREKGYRVGDIEGFQGRLHFYPTFFDKIGLEVINPHERETGAGKNPIYFEAVPAGTKGVFTLLYVSLGAGPTDEATCVRDLAAVARGVQAMLTVYGFGAKTSSGYGVVDDEVKNSMVKINLPDVFKASPPTVSTATDYEPPEKAFLKYLDDELGEVKAAFKGSGEGGLMSNSEYKQQGESQGGGSLSEFKRFRDWYLTHGAAWKAALHTQEPAGSEKPLILQKDFETLSELYELANSLQADVMTVQHEGGENA